MSDEPLYCPHCGAEDFGCDCDPEQVPPREKRFCQVCGVIPRPGGECKFYAAGGSDRYCDPGTEEGVSVPPETR
jgi:hypothetical protein